MSLVAENVTCWKFSDCGIWGWKVEWSFLLEKWDEQTGLLEEVSVHVYKLTLSMGTISTSPPVFLETPKIIVVMMKWLLWWLLQVCLLHSICDITGCSASGGTPWPLPCCASKLVGTPPASGVAALVHTPQWHSHEDVHPVPRAAPHPVWLWSVSVVFCFLVTFVVASVILEDQSMVLFWWCLYALVRTCAFVHVCVCLHMCVKNCANREVLNGK